MMSKLLTLIAVLIISTACSTKKMIYVASTLADCENNPSEKCIQVKENKEDEWTVLNNGIEGFEHKNGFLQKVEVSIRKTKDKPLDANALSYRFLKLIYEQEESPKNMTITQSYTGKWQVNKIVGIDSLATRPTLNFKDGKVSGNAGCNNYGAAFTLAANEITFGLAMATKMMCTNMPIEKTYFDCLAKARTYKLQADTITFYDADTNELMQCKKLNDE